jgi:hypothetical protein
MIRRAISARAQSRLYQSALRPLGSVTAHVASLTGKPADAAFPQPHGTVDLKKGQVSGYDRVSWICVFRRDGVMGLFLVLFWCSVVAGGILRFDSRFGVFNSRLGRRNSRLAPLRESAGKGLIWRVVCAAKTAVTGGNQRNSRFHGNSRKFRRHRQKAPWGLARHHASSTLATDQACEGAPAGARIASAASAIPMTRQ